MISLVWSVIKRACKLNPDLEFSALVMKTHYRISMMRMGGRKLWTRMNVCRFAMNSHTTFGPDSFTNMFCMIRLISFFNFYLILVNYIRAISMIRLISCGTTFSNHSNQSQSCAFCVGANFDSSAGSCKLYAVWEPNCLAIDEDWDPWQSVPISVG